MPSYEVSSQEANNLNLNNIIEDDLREDALARAAANRALNANTMPASSFPTTIQYDFAADGSPPAVATTSTIPMSLPSAASDLSAAAALSTHTPVPPTHAAGGETTTQVPPTAIIRDSTLHTLTGLRARQRDGTSPHEIFRFDDMAPVPEDVTDAKALSVLWAVLISLAILASPVYPSAPPSLGCDATFWCSWFVSAKPYLRKLIEWPPPASGVPDVASSPFPTSVLAAPAVSAHLNEVYNNAHDIIPPPYDSDGSDDDDSFWPAPAEPAISTIKTSRSFRGGNLCSPIVVSQGSAVAAATADTAGSISQGGMCSSIGSTDRHFPPSLYKGAATPLRPNLFMVSANPDTVPSAPMPHFRPP